MKLPTHPRVAERTVKTLCSDGARDIVTVGTDTTILEALTLMAANDQGTIPVLDNGRIVGLFSERDVARSGILGLETPKTVPIRDVMSRCENFASPDQTLQDCLTLMTEKHLHSLPVIEGNDLVGMVFIEELLRAIVSHHERVFHELELDWSILFLRGTYSC
jgi:CBS domain-containing protein